MKAFIKDFAIYLPETVLTNEDLEKQFPEWTAEKIIEKTGIKSRHIVSCNETALDLAEKACNNLFFHNESIKENVDFIILCTQSPEYKLPSTSCILQSRLALPETVGAFDFSLGCSGYEYGLSIAKGLILAGSAKNILLVTAETYSKYVHPLDKGNRSLFGDAATATLVSTEGFAEICESEFGTDGSKAESLIIKNGGSKNPHTSNANNELPTDENGHIISPDHLYMDGGEIFSFTLKRVPRMIKSLLEKSSLTMEDIDLFVFHQANAYMLSHLKKKLKIEDTRFMFSMEDVGNTVSNTIPIALYHAKEENRLNNVHNVLLAGFGVGLSWAGTILRI